MIQIVAVLTHPTAAHICLAAASVAASNMPNAQVEAFHVRVKEESLTLPTEEVVTRKRRAELTAMLDRKSQTLWQIVQNEGGGAVWNKTSSSTVADAVTERGKTADLIVFVRPANYNYEEKAALRAVIFNARCLVLLVPPLLPVNLSFGQHIAILWDGTDHAARAVAEALPWLNHAKRVSLLAIGKNRNLLQLPDSIRAFLNAHNIQAEPVFLSRSRGSLGAQVLSEMNTIGADCIVMGAYRRNWLMELLLGSGMRRILNRTELPVYLCY